MRQEGDAKVRSLLERVQRAQPMQVESWRTLKLFCPCPGAELKAMRQEGWSPGEADGFQGSLRILAVGLISLPLLCPSSSQWC